MKKRRMEHFLYYDYEGIEKHLEKMALKGWLLCKITHLYWVYEKQAPQKLKFSVNYFPDSSEYDPYETEDQNAFHEYCKETGWRFIAHNGQMEIFCNTPDIDIEATPITPIETDDSSKLDVIHRSMKKGFLPRLLLSIALYLLLIFVLFINVNHINIIDIASSNTTLLGFLLIFMFILFMFFILIGYLHWYRKAKRAVKLNEPLPKCSKSLRMIHYLFTMLLYITALLLLIMMMLFDRDKIHTFVLFFIVITVVNKIRIIIRELQKKKESTRDNNRIYTLIATFFLIVLFSIVLTRVDTLINNAGWFDKTPVETYTVVFEPDYSRTWNIYHDTLPLTCEDLDAAAYENYSYEWKVEDSIFLKKSSGTQQSIQSMDTLTSPELFYTVLDVKLHSLYNLCLNSYFVTYKSFDCTELDPAIWHADEVYKLSFKNSTLIRYLVCLDDKIIFIHFDNVPTDEQIEIAMKKLTLI